METAVLSYYQVDLVCVKLLLQRRAIFKQYSTMKYCFSQSHLPKSADANPRDPANYSSKRRSCQWIWLRRQGFRTISSWFSKANEIFNLCALVYPFHLIRARGRTDVLTIREAFVTGCSVTYVNWVCYQDYNF